MEIFIDQLLNEVQTITDSYNRVAESTGENFNLFSILQMESNEVATHSRFIAELLNPKGRHGQRDNFLKLFINFFASDYTLNTDKADVHVEYHIGRVELQQGGRLDILIRDVHQNVIMIENKVYASEQKDQLVRYHNRFPDGRLFFLTLYGEDSKENISKEFYTTLSYEKNIISWLEECRKEAVSIPILRETIAQYIHLLKKLTNQNLNTKMSQEIVKRVSKDEQSFDSFMALVNSKIEVIKSILEYELFPLLETVKDIHILDLLIEKQILLSNSGRWMGFSFTNPMLTDNNLLISFSFNVSSGYRGFIFGFSYLDGTSKDKIDYEELQIRFRRVFGSSRETPGWPCWREYSGYVDWEDLRVLKEVKFGSFKQDFLNKMKVMMEIIEEFNSIKNSNTE